jgi:hypothetical protein
VKLINTDGMAFIGPGSEWFWTAVSGLILGITFLAIYRQLRAQRSANAFGQLTTMFEEWTAERLTRKRLTVWIALRDGRALSDLPGDAAAAIVDHWEKLAGLVRAGHVPLPLVDGMFGNSVNMWWQIVGPHNAKTRVELMDAEIGADFEWLAARVTGTAPPMNDPEFRNKNLERFIGAQEAALRDLEAMRTVIVASASPASASGTSLARLEETAPIVVADLTASAE